jgi:hypothetical protein
MRSAFRIFAIFSTLACALLVVLSFRSIYVGDLIRCRTASHTYFEIATIPSQLRLSRATNWPTDQPLTWMHGPYATLNNAGAIGYHLMDWKTLGFVTDSQTWRVGNGVNVTQMNVRTIALPYPILIAITGLPALMAWIILKLKSRQYKHRKEDGLCVACGYDLRAASERCSECGAKIQTAG